MSGFSAPHCGSLRASDDGREVELYGWVARRRDHGGVTFIDLRDRWGLVQVVIRSIGETEVRNEYVVRVKGKVTRRPGGSENPKMATGEIAVAAGTARSRDAFVMKAFGQIAWSRSLSSTWRCRSAPRKTSSP